MTPAILSGANLVPGLEPFGDDLCTEVHAHANDRFHQQSLTPILI
jgi:hypothetical protein